MILHWNIKGCFIPDTDVSLLCGMLCTDAYWLSCGYICSSSMLLGPIDPQGLSDKSVKACLRILIGLLLAYGTWATVVDRKTGSESFSIAPVRLPDSKSICLHTSVT